MLLRRLNRSVYRHAPLLLQMQWDSSSSDLPRAAVSFLHSWLFEFLPLWLTALYPWAMSALGSDDAPSDVKGPFVFGCVYLCMLLLHEVCIICSFPLLWAPALGDCFFKIRSNLRPSKDFCLEGFSLFQYKNIFIMFPSKTSAVWLIVGTRLSFREADGPPMLQLWAQAEFQSLCYWWARYMHVLVYIWGPEVDVISLSQFLPPSLLFFF